MRRNTRTYIALIGLMLAALFFVACTSSAASTDDGNDGSVAAADDGRARGGRSTTPVRYFLRCRSDSGLSRPQQAH